VHQFSLAGTDVLITVDNGINAREAVLLAQRLGIDVLVIDHHRIQEQANTLAVWSQEFCGAGLAALFAMALALRVGWKDKRIEGLRSVSQYAAIASVADCVPLKNGTRKLARLGMRELGRTANSGLRELLRVSWRTPKIPIRTTWHSAWRHASMAAAGRIGHPARALLVFEAGRDTVVAKIEKRS
jgi:single-stranded-DNA-specific exonuclease